MIQKILKLFRFRLKASVVIAGRWFDAKVPRWEFEFIWSHRKGYSENLFHFDTIADKLDHCVADITLGARGGVARGKAQ